MNNVLARPSAVRRIIPGIVAVAALAGVLGSSPAILDRTSVAAAQVSTTSIAAGTSSGAALVVNAPSAGVTSASGSAVVQPQAAAAARALIEAVKRYGGSAYTAMVNAVKSGYAAFERWFNSLPAVLRVIASGVSVNAIYDAIKSILGL